jgi:LmbE family N-acetylglucosaminyl deacetylase/glycosyltransferase involved in cell wall biosynthesis
MTEENAIVPYEAADIRAERVLALAAHPDDEVFGAGGLLARLAKTAEAVRVVVFTGGEAQERREEGSADPETRRREAVQAGSVLGISDHVFLELPDRSLAARRPELVARVKEQIAGFAPDLLFVPSPCELHPDHRALSDAAWDAAAGSRRDDADHELYRLLRIAYYEVTLPLLPNALVPLGEYAETKKNAMEKFASQSAVRDYAGAVSGLNAFRALTLEGRGGAEAFHVITAREASVTSREDFRRRIGPSAISSGPRQVAAVGVVVRTRNRPAVLLEAVRSLAEQNARPKSVVVVNDGGASPAGSLASLRDAFALTVVENAESLGRAAAANAGAARLSEETIAFLDDDDLLSGDHFERLLAARSAGPEPIVYSDAVTVLLEPDGEGWKERHRELQYSADFDRELLLFSNYIPLHTVLFDAALFSRVGGFDSAFEYSEDWDLLIRLSFEAPFRHIRAVTAQYRVFEGEAGHVPAGGGPFLEARRKILECYRDRWNGETAARVLDRFGARLWRIEERERVASGELAFHRASQRRMAAEMDELNSRLAASETQRHALNGEVKSLEKLYEDQTRHAGGLNRQVGELYTEIERLNALIRSMEGTRAWKLHKLVQSLKGKK